MKKTSEDVQNSAAFRRIELLSLLMDNQFVIPGTQIKIGLDALIGMIPVVGDMSSLALSLYILFESYIIGVSHKTLWKMSFNIGLDFILGLLPILGDGADIFFRANQRNLHLLKQDLKQ